MSIPSPNMSLPVPVVSSTPGPDWAQNVNACLSIIDEHDHSPGRGVKITPAGLDINADLDMSDNNLASIRALQLTPQVLPLPATGSDIGALYMSGVDLYYNDGSGNQIRVTQGGAVTGAAGTITGLPSGTASASFAGGTFTFRSATLTPANMSTGPITIGRNVSGSKTVTLTPHAGQAADYTLTFPPALPGSLNYMTLDATGAISFNSSGFTGTGAVVLATSPTLVTPNLGTPTALVLTNATGLPVGGISGLGTGIATFLATPSSANLAAAVTGETGTGALVFSNSPNIVDPALGTPTVLVLTHATGLPVSTGISGLGAGIAAFLATPSSANLVTAVTDETGSGPLVFSTAPTITGATIGLASGSALLPSLHFSGSSILTGLYAAGTDSIGFSANGVNSGTISSAGVWSFLAISTTTLNGFLTASASTSGIAVEANRASPASTDTQNVYSGKTGTVTTSNLVNVTVGTTSYFWTRIGDIVTVTGTTLSTDIITTGSATTFDMAIPVSRANFTTNAEALGFGVQASTTIQGDAWRIVSVAGSQTVRVVTFPTQNSLINLSFMFSYTLS